MHISDIDTETWTGMFLVMPRANLPLPPGRKGLPFLGETLSYLSDPGGFTAAHQKEYGPIYRTHLFGRPTIMMSGAEAMHFVFKNEHRYFAATWPYSTRKLLGPRALPIQRDPEHMQRRKILRQAFAPRLLAGYVPDMDRIARIHLERWADQRHLVWSPLISAFTFHIACALLVGDEGILDVADEFQTLVKGAFSVPNPLPWSRFGRAKRCRSKLLHCIDRVVRKRVDEGNQPDARDALSVLVRASDEYGAKLSIEELGDQTLTLLLAGHDTSASALVSFCLLTGQHPRIIERLREEQRSIDVEDNLTCDHLKQMSYLDQVVKEVLRVIPPVPGGFRRVIAPCEFGGYSIPKGWIVSYQIHSNHMDPEHFAEPHRFDPDRFAPDRAEDKRTRFALVPFGGGPRVCIGMEFARLEIMVLGARLARHYNWTLKPNQDLTLSFPVPRPRSGLQVEFEPLPAERELAQTG
ncbi:MAG: cytochrome P450 [Proteobacteria bacterium]|nr:cytochrome P450 [Pseudomonadota bacterium]